MSQQLRVKIRLNMNECKLHQVLLVSMDPIFFKTNLNDFKTTNFRCVKPELIFNVESKNNKTKSAIF